MKFPGNRGWPERPASEPRTLTARSVSEPAFESEISEYEPLQFSVSAVNADERRALFASPDSHWFPKWLTTRTDFQQHFPRFAHPREFHMIADSIPDEVLVERALRRCKYGSFLEDYQATAMRRKAEVFVIPEGDTLETSGYGLVVVLVGELRSVAETSRDPLGKTFRVLDIVAEGLDESRPPVVGVAASTKVACFRQETYGQFIAAHLEDEAKMRFEWLSSPQSPWTCKLTKRRRLLIASASRSLLCAAGESLCAEGDNCDGEPVYLVRRGEAVSSKPFVVKQTTRWPAGTKDWDALETSVDDAVRLSHSAGEFLGLEPLFGYSQRRAGLSTSKGVELLALDPSTFVHLQPVLKRLQEFCQTDLKEQVEGKQVEQIMQVKHYRRLHDLKKQAIPEKMVRKERDIGHSVHTETTTNLLALDALRIRDRKELYQLQLDLTVADIPIDVIQQEAVQEWKRNLKQERAKRRQSMTHFYNEEEKQELAEQLKDYEVGVPMDSGSDDELEARSLNPSKEAVKEEPEDAPEKEPDKKRPSEASSHRVGTDPGPEGQDVEPHHADERALDAGVGGFLPGPEGSAPFGHENAMKALLRPKFNRTLDAVKDRDTFMQFSNKAQPVGTFLPDVSLDMRTAFAALRLGKLPHNPENVARRPALPRTIV